MSHHIELARWERSGSPADLPAAIGTRWAGDPRWRASEFPAGNTGSPILSRRVAEALKEDLSLAGTFLPVLIDGSDTGEYVLFLVESGVDCLDERRSSKPKRSGDPLKKAIFRPDAVPVELPAFRVPGSRRAAYWNGWAVDHLTQLLGDDLNTRLVWSDDPALTPHPDPWGF
ncbi:hypothetical protein [Streptomyces sp. A5-4]|uniref:hypothetical protein n=1 Tax=Streptomyces sp. A5-4 TaxID=3384771 RepID=UPI003DA7E4E0